MFTNITDLLDKIIKDWRKLKKTAFKRWNFVTDQGNAET
jgi:hypothetical protein